MVAGDVQSTLGSCGESTIGKVHWKRYLTSFAAVPPS